MSAPLGMVSTNAHTAPSIHWSSSFAPPFEDSRLGESVVGSHVFPEPPHVHSVLPVAPYHSGLSGFGQVQRDPVSVSHDLVRPSLIRLTDSL